MLAGADHERLGFSAALCRGLIEAPRPRRACGPRSARFPRLYAAASLKPALPREPPLRRDRFPRLYAAASLKLAAGDPLVEDDLRFSAALCRGLIEAYRGAGADASRVPFSAALCRGLIEASSPRCRSRATHRCFPRLYAAASLKLGAPMAPRRKLPPVFRGFMPRPH